MYCDFCSCHMCQTGIEELFVYKADVLVKKTYVQSPVYHTQCVDGRWICDTCYHYECCVNAGYNPCKDHNCEHRPKLVNGEWTFWTWSPENKYE